MTNQRKEKVIRTYQEKLESLSESDLTERLKVSRSNIKLIEQELLRRSQNIDALAERQKRREAMRQEMQNRKTTEDTSLKSFFGLLFFITTFTLFIKYLIG